MLKSQSKCSKTIVILLVTILVALSMSALLQVTIPTQYFLSEEISTSELSNVSLIVASARSENEGSDNQIVASLNVTSRQSAIDQSVAVKDVDGQEKYLYVEFASGGYAIYDRIGQFVYERSDIGTGPFHDYINSDYELYYAGPTNYFYKNGLSYYNIATQEKITKTDFDQASKAIDKTRTKYQKGQAKTMSLSATKAKAAPKTFILGQNIKDETMSENAMWYFTVLAMAQTDPSNDSNCIKVWDDGITPDFVCGINKVGSCCFVALSSVLLYYDRIGKANMVPDDVNGFNVLYDHEEIKMYDSRYEDYIRYGNLRFGEIDKNAIKSEIV